MRTWIVLFFVALSSCCGTVVRESTSSSFLIIDAIEAASGSRGQFVSILESDVVTVVDAAPTILQDLGRVTFSVGLKDPALAGGTAPSTANIITVDRYRVRYVRADGRNTPGVDVPYGFDGAFTLTVAQQSSATFVLVRAQAKAEAPLAALARDLVFISTIAEVTFFGRDQTGRAVSVAGRIDVHFGNWTDPQ